MGRNTAGDAASALRLLNSEDLRENPEHGPRERRSTSSTPGTPLNVGMVDYLARTVSEIVDHATAVTPEPAPLPRQIGDLYTWFLDQTAEADDVQRRRRDTLIETHALEHAIRLGETEEVCKHPCPRCGCWGLEWDHGGNRALCLNRRCRTPDGNASTWSPARLAGQKVRRTEIWRRNAT
ncbi:hypothetical protein [Streptomyces sp. LUP47B]|uniref:hypothetical protein n=1 Tax=Streptomyces sp. LUP47B TaxID=1890286 RepID=UPI000851EE78|nr:hypothetical protein [Streptomyces sp. LUP47B]